MLPLEGVLGIDVELPDEGVDGIDVELPDEGVDGIANVVEGGVLQARGGRCGNSSEDMLPVGVEGIEMADVTMDGVKGVGKWERSRSASMGVVARCSCKAA